MIVRNLEMTNEVWEYIHTIDVQKEIHGDGDEWTRPHDNIL